MAKNKRQGKGVFTSIGLPVSSTYQRLASRNALWLYGSLVMAVTIAWLSYDFFVGSGTLTSAGALSSNHATMTKDCGKCHESGAGVVSEKCSVCHEKSNTRIDAHSFAAHYQYVSGDESRISPVSNKYKSKGSECVACHTEHNGQDANITKAPDNRCASCHAIGAFETDHPEFDFITKNLTDDSTLLFTHNRHTGFVLRAFEKSGRRAIVEDACLQCHVSESSGKGFLDINFEKQCSSCHLSGADKTKLLPVASASDAAGVESWQTTKDKLGPIAAWTRLINPTDLVSRAGGKKISKTSVVHADPWIMHNLESLRRKLFVNTQVFDLIGVSGPVTKQQARPLLRKAIARLKAKVTRLRSRPEESVQEDIKKLDSLISDLDVLSYSLSSSQIRSLLDSDSLKERQGLNAGTRAAIEEMSLNLTMGSNGLCLTCHYVEKSAIMRVQKNQKSLLRSRFDHRAHILNRSCTDCHNVIPMTTPRTRADSVLVLQVDASKTFNLPGIANCIKCHNPSAASASCITCHDFHPDKSQRSNLTLSARK